MSLLLSRGSLYLEFRILPAQPPSRGFSGSLLTFPVANGVKTVALLKRMVERKVLTRADVRIILGNGIECLEPRINVRSVAEAIHLMRGQMLPLFAE